jgi:hypothetical protein
LRKATIFDCPCDHEHVVVFDDIPDPYQTYSYRCPKLKKRQKVNGFQVSEECEKRGYRELLARKL